jgi:predicted metalloprotease with PDZ domain
VIRYDETTFVQRRWTVGDTTRLLLRLGRCAVARLTTPAHVVLLLGMGLIAALATISPGDPTLPGVRRDGVHGIGGPDGYEPGRASLPTLTITLRPRTAPTAGIAVIYELSGSVVRGVRSLGMAPSTASTLGPDAVRFLLVRDAKGVIDVDPHPEAGRFHLERPVRGDTLRVSYLAESAAVPGRLDLSVQPDELSAVGYAFLALPEIDRRLAVRLSWKLDAVDTPMAATSFGTGPDVVTVATALELAHSFYLAGSIQEVPGERGERLLALGTPAFDLEEALAFCSATLAGARAQFEPTDGRPFSFVLVPRRGLGTHYDGASLHNGFAIWFDAARPFDTRLRLLAAHEIVHRWIGGALRFTTEEKTDAKWFSEGFTVHYARTVLLRAGLLSPQEFLDDLGRDLGAQANAFHQRVEITERKREEKVLHHAAPEYYRGALYAARLDGLLREANGGGLEELLAGLFERASTEGPALPLAAWRQALTDALGPTADVEFDRMVVLADALIDLPTRALGPCFERVPIEQPVYELGFDEASLAADPREVRGVIAGSAAERAGLRNGQRILAGAETVRKGSFRRFIRLVVTDDQGPRLVRYRPVRMEQLGVWRPSGHRSCAPAEASP